MVWFYGGSWVTGGSILYPGDLLVDTGDVVVVTVNYRLGALGWAVNDELAQESPDYPTSGNYGMLDMLESLRWVQENIQFFGGDPRSVTIFGESAGSLCISFLLVSTENIPVQGLFHRAIMESGVAAQGTGEPSLGQAIWDAELNRNITDNVIDVLQCGTCKQKQKKTTKRKQKQKKKNCVWC